MNLLTFDEITEKVAEMASELGEKIDSLDFDGCRYELEVKVKNQSGKRTLIAEFGLYEVSIGNAGFGLELFVDTLLSESGIGGVEWMNVKFQEFRKEYNRLWLDIARLDAEQMMEEHVEGMRERAEEHSAEIARYQ